MALSKAALLCAVLKLGLVQSEDDAVGLMQSKNVVAHKHQSIANAVANAKAGSPICVQATLGQEAPAVGTFTADDGSVVNAVVSRGEVALKTGTFCVEHETLALMQRAFSFNSASDFDRVLSGKGKKTTTEAGPTEAGPTGPGPGPTVDPSTTEATVSRKQKRQAATTASPIVRDATIPTCDSVSIESIKGCEELCCGGVDSTCETYAAVINGTLSASYKGMNLDDACMCETNGIFTIGCADDNGVQSHEMFDSYLN